MYYCVSSDDEEGVLFIGESTTSQIVIKGGGDLHSHRFTSLRDAIAFVACGIDVLEGGEVPSRHAMFCGGCVEITPSISSRVGLKIDNVRGSGYPFLSREDSISLLSDILDWLEVQ